VVTEHGGGIVVPENCVKFSNTVQSVRVCLYRYYMVHQPNTTCRVSALKLYVQYTVLLCNA
jgi:hypothetical protein